MLIILLLIVFLPFSSFLILIFSQRRLKIGIDWLACGFLFVSFILSIFIFQSFWEKPAFHSDFEWFSFYADLHFKIGLFVDSLSALMLVLVSFISLLVHLFSASYMQGDKHYNRYFAYLGLFTFSMLGLVIADNLLLLYIFWELVGLCSYLLIGFWYEKRSAVKASQKAFLFNRLGDFCFLIGIILVFVHFQTFELSAIATQLSNLSNGTSTMDYGLWTINLIGFCIFCGCVAKSAQFPLYIWLPDAMEGPTPVSALIHAATMVAAGIFLLAKTYFLLGFEVLVMISFIGVITAFIGAFSAMAQKDIKKVLAYSTVSQLGYMVLAMGVGAYSAALLHLLIHAFFKACLFLSAGAIIHSLHKFGKKIDLDFDAQNMYLMGGLAGRMPFTFFCFTLSSLALCGLPFFSGFLSKDVILSAAWAWADMFKNPLFYLVPIFAFLTVFLTAMYVGRMFLLVFFGEFMPAKIYRKVENKGELLEEADWKMKIPLGILALLSFWFVFAWNPFLGEATWLMQGLEMPKNLFYLPENQAYLTERRQQLHLWTSLISVFLVFIGLWLSLRIYLKKQWKEQKLFGSKVLYKTSFESLYWNKLYQKIGVSAILQFSRLTARFDVRVIDAFVNFIAVFKVVLANIIAWFDRSFIDGFVNLLAYFSGFMGKIIKSPQTGKVQDYFMAALLSFILLIWYLAN